MRLDGKRQSLILGNPKVRGSALVGWWLFIGFGVFSLFFLMFSTRIILLPLTYYAALIVVPVVVIIRFRRAFFSSGIASGIMQILVVSVLLAMLYGLASARLFHMVLPQQLSSIELTVEYVTTGSRGCAAGVVFREPVGFMNDRVCGFSREFVRKIRSGDVFYYESKVSFIGYELVRLKQVSRTEKEQH